MKRIAFIVIGFTVIATILIGIWIVGYPPLLDDLIVIGWVISPYAYLTALVMLVTGKISIDIAVILVFLLSIIKAWYIVDSWLINPDSLRVEQFISLPLLEWLILLIGTLSVLVVYLLNRTRGA